MAWNCAIESDGHGTSSPGTSDTYLSVQHEKKDSEQSRLSITFDMNKLQAIPSLGEEGSPGRVLVTMNPFRLPQSPQCSQIYYHPLIDSESMLALQHLHKINGVSSISFAGAWMGYGFHEDGFAAGAHAAQMLSHGHNKIAPLQLGFVPKKPRPRPSTLDGIAKMLISMTQYVLEIWGTI